jgi:hypothetical protein
VTARLWTSGTGQRGTDGTNGHGGGGGGRGGAQVCLLCDNGAGNGRRGGGGGGGGGGEGGHGGRGGGGGGGSFGILLVDSAGVVIRGFGRGSPERRERGARGSGRKRRRTRSGRARGHTLASEISEGGNGGPGGRGGNGGGGAGGPSIALYRLNSKVKASGNTLTFSTGGPAAAGPASQARPGCSRGELGLVASLTTFVAQVWASVQTCVGAKHGPLAGRPAAKMTAEVPAEEPRDTLRADLWLQCIWHSGPGRLPPYEAAVCAEARTALAADDGRA